MTNILTQIGNWIALPEMNPLITVAGIIILAVLGLVLCFSGYKLTRVISTAMGAAIGCGAGYIIAKLLALAFPLSAVVIAVSAIIIGLVCFFIRRFGVFLVVFLSVLAAATALVTEYTTFDKTVVAIIALVAALVLAILSVVYLRPLIIISTALSGGALFANEVFEHLIQIRWDAQTEMYARLGTAAVLALIGIIVQFRKTRNLNK